VIVHSALPEINAATVNDIERFIASEKGRAALAANTPLTPPLAFLANPSSNAVDLVWDAPRESVVTGYEIEWKSAVDTKWQLLKIDPLTRWHMDGLENGKPMQFRMRSLRRESASAWTSEQTCAPGAVTDSSILAMLGRIPLWGMAKIMALSLWSLVRARFQK
jgi:hypothetical protein